MKKGDILIIILAFCIATSLSIYRTNAKRSAFQEFLIVMDDEIISNYTFDENFNKRITIEEEGILNIIEVSNGQIKMIEANCPDQVCVQSRPISKNGEMIVCLPHRLYVKIVSGNDNQQVDIIAN